MATARLPAGAEADLRAHWALSEGESVAGLRLDDTSSGIGYTFKCLGAALWALRHCQTGPGVDGEAEFTRVVRAIVREGGDADTNACVAGAVVGCRLGFSQLPAGWVAELPHASWLEAHAQKLLGLLGLRRAHARTRPAEGPASGAPSGGAGAEESEGRVP
mmetsp:Transcript_62960/g.148331  ORF Transcript_62960/g.148331 Transcript_62960/m.148331 type:complete len:161 (+) Transcript_62960:1063-1545(+)